MKTLEAKEKELEDKFKQTAEKSKTSIQVLKDKFDEMKVEFAKDSKNLTDTNVKDEIATLSQTRAKWINKLNDFSLKKNQIYQSMMNIRRELYIFYKQDYPVKIDSREELNMFIETDASYEYISTLYKHVVSMIEYCENAVKNLNSKQWEITAFQKERAWREGEY